MPFGKDLAEIYDELYETLPSRQRIYSEVLDFFKKQKRGKVLDVGCGTGKLSESLHNLGFEVLGIDKSPGMIKVAQKREKEGLKFQSISFQNFSTDEQFDYLLAVFNVLGYFSQTELASFFNDASSILKKQGFLIFDFWQATIKKVKPIQFNLIRTKKGYYLRMVSSKIKNQKVQIKYRFFNLNNPFRSFSEEHILETFSENALRDLAELVGLKLRGTKLLSDVNQLVILKK